jgi:acyl-[acyl-carrier-protein]-phospholipid O-acyltransferase/long-chain-fatty-acid--[acyl-carrier-protein] ligase
MFTSGSTGRPKGVMMSHHNVVSNIDAMSEVLQFGPDDRIMGVLPPFHSFGFTVTLWLPLTCGVPVVYHPNPLDARGVGAMVKRHKATILLGAPSFYAVYTRGCATEQFASLRLAVVGGQKLMPCIAREFEARFGLPLSEGFGATELAPVVSVNSEDMILDGVHHPARREGSVGRPLPGLAVRILDPETRDKVPEGAVGVVAIKGPSVMRGYLGDPEATRGVLRDGWYLTADLGAVDDKGFLYIRDRLARFSKIAGEMVGHAAVEHALHQATAEMPDAQELPPRRFVVVSVEDAVRGERLVVLYDGSELDVEAVVAALRAADLPNLWVPRPGDFRRLEEVPLLASGKLDLCAARRLAERHIR